MASKVSCVMMVKNEAERISVSLESVKDWIDIYVIFDTGSDDNTKDVIRNWCSKNNKELHMMEGKFVDFSVSRNALLDFADRFNTEYQLLLDSSDELKTGRELQAFCSQKNEPYTGFLIKQVWFCGNSTQSYFNVRLIKSKHKWRYKSSFSLEKREIKPIPTYIRMPFFPFRYKLLLY